MDDLISRQALIDAFDAIEWYHQNRNKDMVSGANPDEHQAWYKADDVYKTLESVPSAQRTGEWIDRSEGGRILNPWWESHKCDQCGYFGSGAWNYCPYCGSHNGSEL